MKRMSISNLVLAATLALLLPLEQAHCAWMGLQPARTPVAAAPAAGHECCKSRASNPAQSTPEPAPRGCVCEQLPSVTLPAAVASGNEATSGPALAVAVPTVVAPVSIAIESVPALDVGSPPLPDDPGAHGLRAPPISA